MLILNCIDKIINNLLFTFLSYIFYYILDTNLYGYSDDLFIDTDIISSLLFALP